MLFSAAIAVLFSRCRFAIVFTLPPCGRRILRRLIIDLHRRRHKVKDSWPSGSFQFHTLSVSSRSTLVVGELRSKCDVIEALQKRSSISAGSSDALLCRPWNRGDLLKRLTIFKSMTWFGKPKVVNAINCSRRGWINVDMDTIACESCEARLLFSTPSSLNQQQVKKAAMVFSLKLDNGHKLLCG